MPLPQSREQALIDSIIELELEMFLEVKNLTGTADCQERPDTFRAMRWMTHSVFPAEYLVSYLDDLGAAMEQGVNLMTIKYGRMDNLVPPFSENPLIDVIADAESAWMQDLRDASPQNFRSQTTEGFRRYFASELETLSDATLDIYKAVVDRAQEQGRNLARERYQNLRERLGKEEGGR